ncbi:MAG TPA: nicotinamide-nucleotide amidohydrolase family protein [Planctomycetota bacterium]|nr:nicotinamide-nucleotide amidohydrolase family protein [Planctomycetota bacterium]
MKVAVISTGTELLRGRNIDTHLSVIARELEPLGLEIGYHSTSPDDLDRVVEEIRLASARAGIVILTGGLGPTEDDYTRRAAAEAFGRPLEFQESLWTVIRGRFRRFRIPIAAINRRQAFLPRGAWTLPNPNGSAPGFGIESGGRLFFALPGPPQEMIPMLRRFVLPKVAPLGRRFTLWESKVYGMPEGDVDEIVMPIVARRSGASYGLSVSGGMVSVSVKFERGAPGPTVRTLKKALGIHLLGPGNLAETVADLLLKKRRTIAVAESCTGGLIVNQLTNVPGISKSLLEGCICYSNASKTARLGVPAELIRRHGAVSREVASAMAEGAARTAGADVGVATTGIAGPSGGTRTKPVGLVWHAVHYRGRTRVERRVFPGDRLAVKVRATNLALDLVRRALLNA